MLFRKTEVLAILLLLLGIFALAATSLFHPLDAVAADEVTVESGDNANDCADTGLLCLLADKMSALPAVAHASGDNVYTVRIVDGANELASEPCLYAQLDGEAASSLEVNEGEAVYIHASSSYPGESRPVMFEAATGALISTPGLIASDDEVFVVYRPFCDTNIYMSGCSDGNGSGTVNFYDNGGNELLLSAEVGDAGTASLEGFWSLVKGGSGAVWIDTVSNHGDVLNVYKVEPESHTVDYDADGGTGAPASQEKAPVVALTLSAGKPVKDDVSSSYTVTLDVNGGVLDGGETTSLDATYTISYVFEHWVSELDSMSYSAGGVYATDASTTMKAVYKANIAVQSVPLPTPHRDSHTFMGWAASASATSGAFASYTPRKSLTLHAIWKPDSYDVAYDAAGGSNSPMDQVKTYGVPLTLSTVKPFKDNVPVSCTVSFDANGGETGVAGDEMVSEGVMSYAFDYWKSSSDGRNYPAGSKYEVDAPTTLTAHYVSVSVMSPITLPTPRKDGFSFKGWAESPSGTSGVTGMYAPTSDTVLYALWDENRYDVTYDAGEGTGAPAAQVKVHGIDLTLSSAVPSRESTSVAVTVKFNSNGGTSTGMPGNAKTLTRTVSYTFSAWRSASDGQDYTPGGIYRTDAPSTMTALYDERLSADSAFVLPTPIRAGHTFNGWSPRSSDMSGMFGEYAPQADVTLYATWRENPLSYSVTDIDGSTSHLEDVRWLVDNGISKGWANGDGTVSFRPYASVTRADMAEFLLKLAERWGMVSQDWMPSPDTRRHFVDVDTSIAHHRAIWWLAENGIAAGWPDEDGISEFRPYNSIARQDAAAFLFKFAKLAGRAAASDTWTPQKQSTKTRFVDVSQTAQDNHHLEVWWLYESGVSTGWPAGGGRYEFRGLAPVARADMAAFLHRMDGLAAL